MHYLSLLNCPWFYWLNTYNYLLDQLKLSVINFPVNKRYQLLSKRQMFISMSTFGHGLAITGLFSLQLVPAWTVQIKLLPIFFLYKNNAFNTSFEIVLFQIKYSLKCIREPLLGPLKNGCSWQVFSGFFSTVIQHLK